MKGVLVILLDEPTSVLSKEEVQLLFRRVRELTTRASFIFVSHRMDDVVEISDPGRCDEAPMVDALIAHCRAIEWSAGCCADRTGRPLLFRRRRSRARRLRRLPDRRGACPLRPAGDGARSETGLVGDTAHGTPLWRAGRAADGGLRRNADRRRGIGFAFGSVGSTPSSAAVSGISWPSPRAPFSATPRADRSVTRGRSERRRADEIILGEADAVYRTMAEGVAEVYAADPAVAGAVGVPGGHQNRRTRITIQITVFRRIG